MDRTRRAEFAETERKIYAVICREDGLKAKEIAERLGMDRAAVNRELYASPLMRELCYQDREYRWHGLIRQAVPHEGLYECCAWYGTVAEFLTEGEEEWMRRMEEGCRRIGRSLNDNRGLFHSFRDCRATMGQLFEDLGNMTNGGEWRDWELAYEFRMNRGKFIRIYSDVLLITRERVFSLEFKMKNRIDPEEVLQAAKYEPYLEIVFGSHYDIIPALVLTGTRDLYEYIPIGDTDMALSVCSGDMLFNLLDEYMGFLA